MIARPAEVFTLYLYYYGWEKMRGRRKGLHVALGILLNLWGAVLMLIANSWASYMMAPYLSTLLAVVLAGVLEWWGIRRIRGNGRA